MLPIRGNLELNTLRAFRPPIVDPAIPTVETPNIAFGDLVRMLAESIADAQISLTQASAEMVVQLANTKIEIVSTITETIDAAGNVTYLTGQTREVSLLDIGIVPPFYQFSDATVEVIMDIKIVETSTESGKRGFTLFANTSDVRFERKLNRDITTSSKLTARLVPVPAPIRIEPARSTIVQPPGT